MTAPRLLIVQHADDCPPGWYDEWLRAGGLELDVVRGHRGEHIPTDLGGYDGLVVLGGEMGAYDDADHPWLTATKALIATTIRAGQCFLGICLGHQLAAVALGGEVVQNPRGHATGLTPVRLTPAGRDDLLLGPTRPDALTIQWNNDVVSRLPPGAIELATSPDGAVQAARFARRAWGVQFHPEASPEIFDGWTVAKESPERADGIDVQEVAAAIAVAEPALRGDWAPLARRFAELARAHIPVL